MFGYEQLYESFSHQSSQHCANNGSILPEIVQTMHCNANPFEKGGTAVGTAGAVLLHHGGASGAKYFGLE